MGMHEPVLNLLASGVAGKDMYSIRAESASVAALSHWERPKLQIVQDLQYLWMFAQAITKQELFIEVMYNGVPVALPGCQDTERACTLEAFLVRHPGLAT